MAGRSRGPVYALIRDSGVGRGTCKSNHALRASRWPRPDRHQACLCGAGYAPNRLVALSILAVARIVDVLWVR
jgi:hypothetical protein